MRAVCRTKALTRASFLIRFVSCWFSAKCFTVAATPPDCTPRT